MLYFFEYDRILDGSIALFRPRGSRETTKIQNLIATFYCFLETFWKNYDMIHLHISCHSKTKSKYKRNKNRNKTFCCIPGYLSNDVNFFLYFIMFSSYLKKTLGQKKVKPVNSEVTFVYLIIRIWVHINAFLHAHFSIFTRVLKTIYLKFI